MKSPTKNFKNSQNFTRDLYQMSREISNDSEPFQQIESNDDHLPLSDLVDEDMIVWNRNDVLGDIILKKKCNSSK